MLKHFKINKQRDRLYVDVAYYQADVSSVSRLALKRGLAKEFLPSWSKFAANPAKGKGFFVMMLEAMFQGKHGLLELNVDAQFEKYDSEPRVAMMFFNHGIRVEALKMAAQYAREALLGFEVIYVNGDSTSNADAERYVNQLIEKTKNEAKKNGSTPKSILILAGAMAQRSFSISEITELYLAYDKGDTGATIQKMSRALTPGELNKLGRIVSLSFDANRDDTFDSVIIETVKNYAKKKSISTKEAFRQVIPTLDIFQFSPTGAIKADDPDQYLASLNERNSISRVIGKIADFSGLTSDQLQAIANGNGNYLRNNPVDPGVKGQTRPKKKNNPRGENDEPKWLKEEKEIEDKARKVVTTIAENIDFIIAGTDATSVNEALSILEKDVDGQEEVAEIFEVEFSLIKFLFDSKVINEDLLSLRYDH